MEREGFSPSAPIETLAIQTIRTLAIDMVEAAASGHPGTAMALAPLAYRLWTRHLRYDPKRPDWHDRDRFVLSAGHASALLYAILHLSGYAVTLEDIKQFRQWGSRAAGHPERGLLPGIEVTTGPLGQGFANAVGMALAERRLAAIYNRYGHTVINHHTVVICGDGDLMEGIHYEAASFAGFQKLGKLICFYDDNQISIAGPTRITFTEDIEGRFSALGWQTLLVEDANDLPAIDAAVESAKANHHQPTLIRIRSRIGFGSPNKENTSAAHGEPLGEKETRLTKRAYGWPEDASFLVPVEVRAHFDGCSQRGASLRAAWDAIFDAFKKAQPEVAAEFRRQMEGRLPPGWKKACDDLEIAAEPEATRNSSARAIQRLAQVIPELVGGSADLAPSTKTYIQNSGDLDPEHPGERNIRYGIREHSMGAILNGLAAHGGVRPFGSTFFAFSDYCRPAIRLAALSGHPSIFVFTHDSIGLGEDGPTHQPIEHLASLRALPGLCLIRPADARETAEAWKVAIERRNGPTALVLSRQKLPQLARDNGGEGVAEGAQRGGYVLRETKQPAKLTLIATGSEVATALGVALALEVERIPARVVSLPSWDLFDEQSAPYRDEVLGPAETPRIALEAGSTLGWERYTGSRDRIIGLDRFGASAPGPTNLERFGFDQSGVMIRLRELGLV